LTPPRPKRAGVSFRVERLELHSGVSPGLAQAGDLSKKIFYRIEREGDQLRAFTKPLSNVLWILSYFLISLHHLK
jgi:hypothetical protein